VSENDGFHAVSRSSLSLSVPAANSAFNCCIASIGLYEPPATAWFCCSNASCRFGRPVPAAPAVTWSAIHSALKPAHPLEQQIRNTSFSDIAALDDSAVVISRTVSVTGAFFAWRNFSQSIAVFLSAPAAMRASSGFQMDSLFEGAFLEEAEFLVLTAFSILTALSVLTNTSGFSGSGFSGSGFSGTGFVVGPAKGQQGLCLLVCSKNTGIEISQKLKCW